MRTSSLVAAAFALMTSAPLAASAQRPDSSLVGTWTGRATVTVPWTAQRELAIRLVVRDDGSVSGTIGDAQLVGARIFSDRTAVARALRLGREYAVEGSLAGAIIRAEGVVRESVRMRLDLAGSDLKGELQTSGAYEGSPTALALTAGSIVLRRTSPIASLKRAVATSPR